MAEIRVMKRGKVYQYQFEIASQRGVRKYINKSVFATRKEAQEAGATAYNDFFKTGRKQKIKDMSYSDYLDYWLDNYCKTNLKYNTIQTYTIIISKYLKPNLGKFKLYTITSVSLNSFIVNLVNKYTFSKTYFKNILKVIKGSFRDACNLYGFIKYNPALRLPKIDQYQTQDKHYYTQEEIDMILNRFKDNSTFIAAFITSCYTGMRTSEVFALTWDDIDFEDGTIFIQHSVYNKPKDDLGRWFLGSTKTISGTRKIYMSDTLNKALLNYKNRQDYLKSIYDSQYKYYHLEDVKNEYGKVVEKRIVINNELLNNQNINLVFTKDDGTYIGTDILKYPFKIIHNELKINSRFYDLRGTYATKILNNGTELKDVANILGHSNVITTENYYIRSLSDNRRNATEIADKVINSQVINNVIEFKVGESV